MNILHINASYKPAFIYGGPTVSVAKMCEEINKAGSRCEAEGLKLKAESELQSFDFLPTGQDGAQPDSAQPDSKNVYSDLLKQEKIEVTVYTTLANGREELTYRNGEIRNVEGVDVHYFKRITKDHSHLSPSFLLHFWKTIKQFDIVHIHAWWNLVSVGAALICVLKSRPYILSPRGTLSSYSFYNRKSVVKRIFHLLIGRPLLKRAVFQVSSGKEKKDIENILGFNSQISVIPNFVELKQVWEKNFKVELSHHKAELLFFSRIEEKKGLEFLLEACALLKIPYHLTIAGSGEESYLTELKHLSVQLGIEQQVTWLGLVASENKFDVLAQYDLLILPSYDENFANVVIESLACGTPVLLSPNVGLADYVTDQKLGWVVDQNPRLIATTLSFIFNKNKSELIDLRIKATAIIKKDFAEEKLRKSYLQFYQSLLNEPI